MDVMINQAVVRIFPDTLTLFQAAVEDFARRALQAVKDKEFFSVVLSGGETPKLFYEVLAQYSPAGSQIPWEKIKFFFGDERYVSAGSAASNYHLAHQYLFSKVPVMAQNIFPIPTELKDPHQAASKYAATLRKEFNLKPGELPLFDLVYLGMGADAHTASLMPASDVVQDYLQADSKVANGVVALFATAFNMYRITMTPALLNNSAAVCFLVKGEDKAAAVHQVLQGTFNPLEFPAQMIRCVHGDTVWFLDGMAAQKLASAGLVP